jgi:hypothetical protein
MARSFPNGWLVVLAFIACQTVISSASADAVADEQKIREQLARPTSLDCKQFPLPETLEFLADYHQITISLDRTDIKKIGLDLGPSQVTKKTTGRLDDTLIEILGPFNLSFMIEGDKVLITSQPKARAWQEKYATSRGRSK